MNENETCSANATINANTCSPFPTAEPEAEQTAPLSPDEEAALRACEETIENGLQAIWKMAEALKQIHDWKLYRATHRTFEGYVEERWDFGIRRAQQILSAFNVRREIEAAGIEDLPVNEIQLRSVTSLPVEEAVEVWADLVETTPAEKRTGAVVRKAVQKRYGAPARGDAEPVPDQNEAPQDEAWTPWSREAMRALKAIPEDHRERFVGMVNSIIDSPSPTAEDVFEAAAGYAAAVLEDGTSAPAVLVGEAAMLVADAAASDADDEEPFIDIPILDDADPAAYDPAIKRNVAFLGAAQKKPLLVSIPRTLLPRPLRRELPEGVVSVIVEIGELERHGGPVRRGILDVELIRQAARDARMRAQFTYTNHNVDWARFTINPLTGCRHHCSVIFCYASGIAQRLFPQGFIPTLHPARLDAFAQTRLPDVSHLLDDAEAWRERSVFNTSMGDLFGAWVPDWYIEQVLAEVGANPGWFSFFLTKNPGRLLGFKFPSNCAVGITLTGEEGGTYRHADAEKQRQIYEKRAQALAGVQGAQFTWLSVEPFRAEVFDLSPFVEAGVEMVAVGGQSRTRYCPAAQPDLRWVDSLRHQVRSAGLHLFEKKNLTVRPNEIPFPAGRPLEAPGRRGLVRVPNEPMALAA